MRSPRSVTTPPLTGPGRKYQHDEARDSTNRAQRALGDRGEGCRKAVACPTSEGSWGTTLSSRPVGRALLRLGALTTAAVLAFGGIATTALAQETDPPAPASTSSAPPTETSTPPPSSSEPAPPSSSEPPQ